MYEISGELTNSDHYMVAAKFREILPVNKQVAEV
jgi:hypothetical protein